MYIELIDLLRCPHDHEETWLVAAFEKMDGRFVREALLGCPVCRASFAVRDGIAAFDTRPGEVLRDEARADRGDPAAQSMRIAAQLGLTSPGSVVVLEGTAAQHASAVAELVSARVVCLNPASVSKEAENVAAVYCRGRIPLAAGSVTGVVVRSPDGGGVVDDVRRVLSPGGRIVLPSAEPVPGGFTEVVRDDYEVVAESPRAFVPLSRPRAQGTSK